MSSCPNGERREIGAPPSSFFAPLPAARTARPPRRRDAATGAASAAKARRFARSSAPAVRPGGPPTPAFLRWPPRPARRPRRAGGRRRLLRPLALVLLAFGQTWAASAEGAPAVLGDADIRRLHAYPGGLRPVRPGRLQPVLAPQAGPGGAGPEGGEDQDGARERVPPQPTHHRHPRGEAERRSLPGRLRHGQAGAGEEAFFSDRRAGAAIGWWWTSGPSSRPSRRPGALRRCRGHRSRRRPPACATWWWRSTPATAARTPARSAVGERPGKSTSPSRSRRSWPRSCAGGRGSGPCWCATGTISSPSAGAPRSPARPGRTSSSPSMRTPSRTRRCAARPPTCSPGAGRAARRRGGSRRGRTRRTAPAGSISGDTSRWSVRRWRTCPARVRTG